MLLVSVGLRLCMAFGLDTRAMQLLTGAARQEDFTRAMVFLQTGQAEQEPLPLPEPEPVVLYLMDPRPKPAPPAPVPPPAPAPDPVPPPPPLPAALADPETLQVVGGCTYAYDRTALVERPSALEFPAEGPQVLILHTHGTEAYTPEPGDEYDPSAPYRTLDPAHSVIAVGEVLAQTLRDGGLEVIHDTTIHDYPDFNSSYWNALETLEDRLDQYPEIPIVIDLHRDGVEDQNGNAVPLSAEVAQEQVAQIMLVVGTDQGGLEHPHWEENLANGLKLQSVLDGMYPGFCRKLNLRTERFNQHVRPGALLVEVGSNGNTLAQAKAAAALLGDAMVRTINSLQTHGGTLACG